MTEQNKGTRRQEGGFDTGAFDAKKVELVKKIKEFDFKKIVDFFSSDDEKEEINTAKDLLEKLRDLKLTDAVDVGSFLDGVEKNLLRLKQISASLSAEDAKTAHNDLINIVEGVRGFLSELKKEIGKDAGNNSGAGGGRESGAAGASGGTGGEGGGAGGGRESGAAGASGGTGGEGGGAGGGRESGRENVEQAVLDWKSRLGKWFRGEKYSNEEVLDLTSFQNGVDGLVGAIYQATNFVGIRQYSEIVRNIAQATYFKPQEKAAILKALNNFRDTANFENSLGDTERNAKQQENEIRYNETIKRVLDSKHLTSEQKQEIVTKLKAARQKNSSDREGIDENTMVDIKSSIAKYVRAEIGLMEGLYLATSGTAALGAVATGSWMARLAYTGLATGKATLGLYKAMPAKVPSSGRKNPAEYLTSGFNFGVRVMKGIGNSGLELYKDVYGKDLPTAEKAKVRKQAIDKIIRGLTHATVAYGAFKYRGEISEELKEWVSNLAFVAGSSGLDEYVPESLSGIINDLAEPVKAERLGQVKATLTELSEINGALSHDDDVAVRLSLEEESILGASKVLELLEEDLLGVQGEIVSLEWQMQQLESLGQNNDSIYSDLQNKLADLKQREYELVNEAVNEKDKISTIQVKIEDLKANRLSPQQIIDLEAERQDLSVRVAKLRELLPDLRDIPEDNLFDILFNTPEPNTTEPNTTEPNTTEPNTTEPKTPEPNVILPGQNIGESKGEDIIRNGLVRKGDGITQTLGRQIDKMNQDQLDSLARQYGVNHFDVNNRAVMDMSGVDNVRSGAYKKWIAELTSKMVSDIASNVENSKLLEEGWSKEAIGKISVVPTQDINGNWNVRFIDTTSGSNDLIGWDKVDQTQFNQEGRWTEKWRSAQKSMQEAATGGAGEVVAEDELTSSSGVDAGGTSTFDVDAAINRAETIKAKLFDQQIVDNRALSYDLGGGREVKVPVVLDSEGEIKKVRLAGIIRNLSDQDLAVAKDVARQTPGMTLLEAKKAVALMKLTDQVVGDGVQVELTKLGSFANADKNYGELTKYLDEKTLSAVSSGRVSGSNGGGLTLADVLGGGSTTSPVNEMLGGGNESVGSSRGMRDVDDMLGGSDAAAEPETARAGASGGTIELEDSEQGFKIPELEEKTKVDILQERLERLESSDKVRYDQIIDNLGRYAKGEAGKGLEFYQGALSKQEAGDLVERLLVGQKAEGEFDLDKTLDDLPAKKTMDADQAKAWLAEAKDRLAKTRADREIALSAGVLGAMQDPELSTMLDSSYIDELRAITEVASRNVSADEMARLQAMVDALPKDVLENSGKISTEAELKALVESLLKVQEEENMQSLSPSRFAIVQQRVLERLKDLDAISQ
jgi:hypothetical protein